MEEEQMLIVHLTRQQKETASAYAKRMRYLERYVHILPECLFLIY